MIDDVFARYGADPHADTRQRRVLTVAHDVLNEPPSWALDHVRHLHDSGHLGTTRLDDLTTRLVHAALHRDQHGHLPNDWQITPIPPPVRDLPEVEGVLPEL